MTTESSEKISTDAQNDEPPAKSVDLTSTGKRERVMNYSYRSAKSEKRMV